MTLRARLFLLFGGLAVLLVIGQWLLARTLTRDLSARVGEVAVSVGKDVFSGIEERRFMRVKPLPGSPDVMLEGEAKTPEFSGRRIAVIEMEGANGETWVQDVFRLDTPSGAEEGRTAVLTYQFQLDEPQDARSLMVRGPVASHEIPIPSFGVKESVERASNRLLLGTLVILVAGLVLAAVVAHRVTAPLRGLATAARTVGGGELGAQAPERGGGEVRQAISSFNKMSARLRELDATAAQLRAREHLTELGEIARGLAHTLRNPLNALGLSLEELASRSGNSPESEELVASSRRQIRRIDTSIRSFLALASEGGGQVEEIDVHGLVQDVALEVLQDQRHGVSLDIREPEKPLRVTGVAPELRAVIQALVVNAVEASSAGESVAVRIGPGEEGRLVRVEIADGGAGVAPEIAGRLFTPHVTTKPNGSGMGLYLADRIATTRYGGAVSLRARESGGTLAVLEIGNRERGSDG